MTYINWLINERISGTWAEHIARGSLGGIDFAVPVGTPIKAPTAGWVKNVRGNGSGGWYVEFTHDPGNGGLGAGWRDEFLHLSGFANEDYYGAGDIIGYSGGEPGHPGAGSSDGPHIHWHLINGSGVRVNPLDYASAPPTPPPVPPIVCDNEDMNLVSTIDAKSPLKGVVFLVGQQFIHGCVAGQLPALTQVYDQPIKFTTETALTSFVVAHGIPREKIAAVVGNKTWSRVNELKK